MDSTLAAPISPPAEDSPPPALSLSRVAQTWWPLAASWLLMAVELPPLSAVMARLADPETHLAAYGGVVFPLALIIEAPIIMLLASSTALSRDWESYQAGRRYMLWMSGVLTALHVLVAFTPLYDLVVVGVIGAPAEIVEPARIGLRIMTPWTGSIAYRRFTQGVLIRFGHPRAVGIGTVVRLAAVGTVLAVGYTMGALPGIVVGTAAVTVGVVAEAIYSGLRVQPVLRDQVRNAPKAAQPLTLQRFIEFYVPLAMTSLLFLMVQPLGSATLSRMPRALESLAVWPVISGLTFMTRSAGVAYNEVVVALADEPGARRPLQKFTWLLIGASSLVLLLIAGTPLSSLWFGRVSGLRPELAALGASALWFALPLPGLGALLSWYQGLLVSSRRTRGVTEAVAVFLLVAGAILTGGVIWGQATGLYVGWVAFSLGTAAQVLWLAFRARPVLAQLAAAEPPLNPAPPNPSWNS